MKTLLLALCFVSLPAFALNCEQCGTTDTNCIITNCSDILNNTQNAEANTALQNGVESIKGEVELSTYQQWQQIRYQTGAPAGPNKTIVYSPYEQYDRVNSATEYNKAFDQ